MRIVTPKSHPRNVTVFQTGSLNKALELADSALRQEHIQAAVWSTAVTPIDPENEEKLRLEYIKTTYRNADLEALAINEAMEPRSTEVTVHLSDHSGGLAFGYDASNEDLSEHLDPIRFNNMKVLREVFSSVKLAIRHERKSTSGPHYDYDGIGNEGREEDDTKPFRGNHIRILNSRTREGTIIYDFRGKQLTKSFAPSSRSKLFFPDGEYILPEGWQVPLGSYLFVCGKNWGDDKAILHTSPAFQNLPMSKPRILDVYDCDIR